MTTSSSDIVLLGINARYRHTAFGLRCLQANLGELESRSVLVETTISQFPMEIVERVLKHNPRIVGLGVYVWNTTLCEQVSQLLKTIRPDIHLVLGGPEISYETESQLLFGVADTIVCGEGEAVFAGLCRDLLDGESPQQKVFQGTAPPMEELASPYRLYTDEDIAKRVTYVEASRGCPYRCQFCLSSLDKAVRAVDPEAFFADMNDLIERGARDFKFIDRTFNLNIQFSLSILEFFLNHERQDFSLHFEMVPDRLPEELRQALQRFPPGMVQLEIGIQTFNPDVSKRIQRPQRIERITENLQFLRQHTEMYLHVDLIVGLPGESVASFGEGFDKLLEFEPHEIQVGVLKRLKGTPIVAHDQEFEMKYSPLPPFEILSNVDLSFEVAQEMKCFAKYWEMVANRGQFQRTAPLIWRDQDSAFVAFHDFSMWLYERVKRTTHINLLRLAEHLFDYLVTIRGLDEHEAGKAIVADLHRTGGRSIPQRLQPFQTEPTPPRSAMSHSTGRERQERRQ
jgi:radical SAM superfamily enzyme YgiQ (UPF0313 family)